MHITTEERAAAEVLFKRDCGNYDSKHINNLADREVPEDLLERIETGCPIEALDEIAKDFPICKYRTQITIHGKFPAIHTKRVGAYGRGRYAHGYVNLVQNKNGSIGVRWEGIDNQKKQKLFGIVAPVDKWSVVHNSTTYCIRKMRFVNKENYEATYAEYKAKADTIDQTLFFGGAGVYKAMTMFGPVLLLEVDMHGYYEKNYEALVANLTGMPYAEAVAKLEAIKAAKAEEARKWKEECNRRHAEYEAKQAQLKADNEAWMQANPPEGFVREENHTLVKGEVIARPTKDREGKVNGWGYAVIGSAFGKTTARECDRDGKPGIYRGREVQKVGTYWVKVMAKKVVPTFTPKTAATAPAAAVTAVKGGVEVRENAAKGGVEIRFASKPDAAVLENLKANGWRWSRFSLCWYNRATDANRAYAKEIADKSAV